MKHFIYFSRHGPTSGNFKDLMKAGRLDIAIHSFIQAIYLSNDYREDVKFHFIFYGMADPPKHIEITVTPKLQISKKDVANFIKKILYKYKPGEKKEVMPGCFIEKRSFIKVIDELKEDGSEIFFLDKKGDDIREVEIKDNCVFVLGDQEGLPTKEMKRFKKMATKISIGPKVYFASQTVAIVNNELDRRNI